MQQFDITSREIEQAFERVLSSTLFQASPALGRLLRFIVEQTIMGNTAGLTESVIARRVFAAPATFDPETDLVVTLQTRRLRKKLSEYRASQGRHDPVWIALSEESFRVYFVRNGLPR